MRSSGARTEQWFAPRRLYPGYFAFVMATGIVSTAADIFHLHFFSDLLLWIGAAGYATLLILYIWRIFAYTQAVQEDAGDAGKAFGFFTFVAASNVLAVRYAAAGALVPAVALAGVGAAGWLALTYTIPVALMLAPQRRRIGPSVNGSWLIWVVATQSVSTIASTLAAGQPAHDALLAFLAITYWAIGVILYLALITIITWRLLLAPTDAGGLTPAYWINMGATAITVLAAARILAVPLPAHLEVLRPVVLGFSFMLWAFGSFWIPAMVLFGIWRYGRGHHPVKYEPALWSMVFPLGMYATATELFGKAAGLPWLPPIAAAESWVGYAAWVMVFSGLIGSLITRVLGARRALRITERTPPTV